MQPADQRTRTLRLLGISAVAALVVVGIAIALSQGGDDSGGSGKKAGGATAATATAKLFDGIPQQGARLGRADAPVRMVEFVDLQCPFCAEYTRAVLPTLVKGYVRTGKLSIELRPLTFLGDDSVTAGKALASAAAQNRGWQFSDLFYANQGAENSGYVTPAFLRKIAKGAGASPQQAIAASQSPVTPPLLAQANSEGDRYKVAATPSFLLAARGQPLRRFEVSQLVPEDFTGPIDALLKQ